MRDGYYLQRRGCCCRRRCCKPITIAVAFFVFVLLYPSLSFSSSYTFLHALVLSLDNDDDDRTALHPSGLLDLARFSLIPACLPSGGRSDRGTWPSLIAIYLAKFMLFTSERESKHFVTRLYSRDRVWYSNAASAWCISVNLRNCRLFYSAYYTGVLLMISIDAVFTRYQKGRKYIREKVNFWRCVSGFLRTRRLIAESFCFTID